MRWLWLALILCLVAGCTGPQAPASGKVRVAVSIPPLADFVRQVGGERVEVVTLVPPGASVHTYEPSPRQIEFVARAEMLVLNGLGLEFWADKVVKGSGNPKLLVVDTSVGVETIAGDEGGGVNPHIWLDPAGAKIQVADIRDGLTKVDPGNSEFYRGNAARYIQELDALNKEIAARAQTWAHKEFVSFHSAWVYFARRYGLEQVAVIEEFPGKEPSPEYLAQVVNLARRIEARAIFAEPQLPPKVAQTVASESGKTVLLLDPLGGVESRNTYIELMRYNVGEMEKALK
jgi:zinc transport system substrate-binding protein